MLITGTYINAIAGDIPSQNWCAEEWAAQFDVLVKMRMDTVVMMDCGWGERHLYPTRISQPLMVYGDFLEMVLSLSDERKLKVYMGTYNTGYHWYRNDWKAEVEACLPFVDEVWERYHHHPSFYGWNMSHEGDERYQPQRIWKPMAERMKKLDPGKPILVPFRYPAEKYHGVCFGSGQFPLNPGQHGRVLESMLAAVEGLITHAAFMDGHCHFHDLKAFVEVTAEVCGRFGVDFWANVETFDRDMPWRFPPIEWEKLKFKMEVQAPYVKKMITFEAPHFLSPYSMFPSARCLYDRYCEYFLP